MTTPNDHFYLFDIVKVIDTLLLDATMHIIYN